jgi:hypothetical protein
MCYPRYALIASLCFSSALCTAADKPVVFNHVSGQPSESDRLLHEHFDKLFTIIDIRDQEHTYTLPKGISGFGLPPPVYVGGHCLKGHTRGFFVIMADGVVTSPYFTEVSTESLANLAIQRVEKWRYQPATLDGRPIPTVVETYVGFYCPVELKEIVGLWQFPDKAIWIKLGNDGSAFQCRMGGGEVFASKGHFEKPYSIAWDKYWGTQPLDYSEEALTVVSRGHEAQLKRVQGPMAPECMRAEHGS